MKFGIKNKTIFNYASCLIAALALVDVIMYGVYMSKNGASSGFVIAGLIIAILLEAFLFLYDGEFAPLAGAVAGFLLILCGALAIGAGIGNILDTINNFEIYGDASLTGLTLGVTIVAVIAGVLQIVSIFLPKTKKEN